MDKILIKEDTKGIMGPLTKKKWINYIWVEIISQLRCIAFFHNKSLCFSPPTYSRNLLHEESNASLYMAEYDSFALCW